MGQSKLIHRIAAAAEWSADRIANVFVDRSQWKIGVQTYRTYGTPTQLRFSGRVLREPGKNKSSIHDSAWKNLKASFHQFESDEVPGTKVTISSETQIDSARAIADEEGYLHLPFPLREEASPGWNSLTVSIDELPYGQRISERDWGKCLVPSPDARFGIISDIDDTVLHTQVSSKLKMLLWSITHNGWTRLPLPGVARLYRQLTQVNGTENVNPVLYVSSSPWNLYPTLVDFLDGADLPKGPILLQDLGIGAGSSLGGNHDHKGTKISEILKTYPNLNFLLFGDTGQHDAEIYSRVAADHPGRILSIYLRHTRSIDEQMLIQASDRCEAVQCPLLVVEKSAQIAAHIRETPSIPAELPPAPTVPHASDPA